MKKYFIRLEPTDDPNELPYPYEYFDTEFEAEEMALFRSANHGLKFQVCRRSESGVEILNEFAPLPRSK